MSFLESPSSIACNGYPDRYQQPHLQQHRHRYTNHAEPIITGSGLDWPHATGPQQALKARHEPLARRDCMAMVDTRSILLIDDGIGMQSDRWWPAPP